MKTGELGSQLSFGNESLCVGKDHVLNNLSSGAFSESKNFKKLIFAINQTVSLTERIFLSQ